MAKLTGIAAGLLVDGTGKPPRREAIVLIDDGRIAEIIDRTALPASSDLKLVDAADATVIPGLIDAHVHVADVAVGADTKVDDVASFRELFLGQFAVNGITTVRDTGGPNIEPSFRLLKTGPRHWPRFFGSGMNLDGMPGAPWAGLIPVGDEADAREQARRLMDQGVDFLKLYVWMTAPQVRAVCEEAHRRGVRVAAHVGHVITAEEAILSGVDALEHVRIGRELVPEERRAELDALPARATDWCFDFRAWRFIDPQSDAAGRMIDLLLERKIFMTPTLTVGATVFFGNRPEITEPEGIELMPESVREQWRSEMYCADYSPDDFAWAEVEWSRQLQFIGRAHAAGVQIVAGTDTPNPCVLPGTSLHREMELLAQCGLSPMDVIVAATRRAAELIGRDSEFGTVVPGKSADLVILEDDPLRDIRNTRKIRTVMREGKVVYGRSDVRAAQGINAG